MFVASFLRLQVCNYACFWYLPLVGDDGPEACTGFPVGGIDACPLVELSLVSLVGRSMSGVCLNIAVSSGFRQSVCLFTLWVLWPEVSKHRSLQSVG